MLRVAKILLFCSLTSASVFHAAEPTTARGLDGALREKLEAAGEELPGAPAPRITTPDRARRQQALEALGNGGLLLVPESTNDRVMAFDPTDGTLIDPDFIPADPDNLATPINAVLNDEGNRVLVVDQLEDLIFQYTLKGSFDGIFAPAGGPNTAVYDKPARLREQPPQRQLPGHVGWHRLDSRLRERRQLRGRLRRSAARRDGRPVRRQPLGSELRDAGGRHRQRHDP